MTRRRQALFTRGARVVFEEIPITSVPTGHGLPSVVASLSNVEKVDLLSGFSLWKTRGFPRLGIPSITMTDGTYGVRYSIEQIDNDIAGGQDIDAFLNVVNRKADEVQVAWGSMKPATCFANGSSLGCSWDVDLAYEVGTALARECQSLGVHLLLGPGINLRRTPLAGRAYEYFSEDPVLTGDIAAAIIRGLQDHGVGAALKHLAGNNSEIERTTMDSVVEERALREIYLLGFQRAVAKSDPWTVMSSYNKLNGVQAAESHWLLTKVLREDWGYQGLVMSDWHGIKDRPASLRAGTDLDMPENDVRKEQLLAALDGACIPAEVVDRACERVLTLVRKAKEGERRASCDLAVHHALARRAAAESIVLLRNAGAVLPLDPQSALRIAVVGAGAVEPVIQGSGSATTTPTGVDKPLAAIGALAGPDVTITHCRGVSENPDVAATLQAEAVAAARAADVVVVFASTEVGHDGEGSDRRTLDLAPGQDALIAALAAVHSKVIVVLANPDAVLMPWLDDVAAIIETFFSGQGMGGGVADILFGRANPSGKLTVTFPRKVQDIPGFPTYPGENSRHVYCEGLFVGYRYYNLRGIEPLFPFGFGLSYTSFAYSDLTLDRAAVRGGEGLTATFTLTNTGRVRGKEIAQLYLAAASGHLVRCARDLRGFAKIDLAPGESQRVSIALDAHDFEIFDPERGRWVLESGPATIEIGASSRDIRLSAALTCDGGPPRHRKLAFDTQPVYVLENPNARAAFRRFLAGRLKVGENEADRLLEHCRSSFFGIFTTLDRRLRLRVSEAEIQALIEAVNAA